MGLVHVKAGVEAADLQKVKTRSNFYYWDSTWDSAYPGDAGAYPATALADALADLETYVTKMQAVSDAGLVGIMVSEIRGFGSATMYPGSTEPYLYCSDRCVLQILTQSGGISHPSFPAPKEAAFLTGSDVLDLTNADVQALATALTSGGVCDDAGNIYKAVLSGYRDSIGAKGKNPGGR